MPQFYKKRLEVVWRAEPFSKGNFPYLSNNCSIAKLHFFFFLHFLFDARRVEEEAVKKYLKSVLIQDSEMIKFEESEEASDGRRNERRKRGRGQ